MDINDSDIFLDDRSVEIKQKIYAFLTLTIPLLASVVVLASINDYTQYPVMDIILFVIFYLLTTLGISVGYHRLFAHKAYKPNRVVKILFAIMGSLAAQGPVVFWAATHRRHHIFSDKEGDVHSPRLSKNKLAGLLYAHVGWMLISKVTNPIRFSKDLIKDQDIRIISKYYYGIVLAGILIPGVIAYSVYGTMASFIEGAIWGGLVRMFIVHHITWALNSFAHVIGKQDYKTGDFSRNIAVLSVISMGESWHNNHHAFPKSALFGVGKWQPDPGYWLIKLLEKLNLISGVRMPHNIQSKIIS